jgi:hypothetical protein
MHCGCRVSRRASTHLDQIAQRGGVRILLSAFPAFESSSATKEQIHYDRRRE